MNEAPEDIKTQLPDATHAARFYVVLIAVLLFGSGFITLGLDAFGLAPGDQLFLAIATLIQGALTVVVIYFYCSFYKLNFMRSLRLSTCGPMPIIWACVGIIPLGILMGQVGALLVRLFPFLESQSLVDLVALSAFGDPIVFAIFALSLSLAPGITEELAFRGIILRGLESSVSPKAAILVSAFVFALFHLEPLHIILAFPGGVFFGYLVIRTGSIIPAIAAHIFNNLWASVESALWQAQIDALDPAEVLFSGGYAPWTLAIATAVFIVAFYFLYRRPGEKLFTQDDDQII